MNKQELADTALQLWQGVDANVKVAQEALLHRTKCNGAAREGKYNEKLEMGEPAAGRWGASALALG